MPTKRPGKLRLKRKKPSADPYKLLEEIRRRPGLSTRNLARRLRVDPVPVFKALRVLRDKRLVWTQYRQVGDGRGYPAQESIYFPEDDGGRR